jgi:MFS superfamily sulfate permease-like transporter
VLLLDRGGLTRFGAGLGVVVTVFATAVASEVFAGTALGCCWTAIFFGIRCAERKPDNIRPIAKAAHAASAVMVTRRTSLRRA